MTVTLQEPIRVTKCSRREQLAAKIFIHLKTVNSQWICWIELNWCRWALRRLPKKCYRIERNNIY